MGTSRIAIIGLGYVGLATAACLADLGHDVVGIDHDAAHVSRLSATDLELFEPGLADLVRSGVHSDRLRLRTDVLTVADCEIVVICVPTPSQPDGSTDMAPVAKTAGSIAPYLRMGATVVVKSTVPVGGTAMAESIIDRRDVTVVTNPEFLREGFTVHDVMHPDRIVVGASTSDAAMPLRSLYAGLGAPILVTSRESAELIKYASNAYLATRLSFVNELARLADALGADIDDVMAGIGSDPRIGHAYLAPGPGWGGSCLPKDSRGLVHMADEVETPLDVVTAAIEVNARQPEVMADLVEEVTGPLAGRQVAAWGLTFKGQSDDLRCSPSLDVLARLVDRGAIVRAHDPAVAGGSQVMDGVEVVGGPVDACVDAEVVVVLTDWDVYRDVDWRHVGRVVAARRIVDTRHHVDRGAAKRAGFEIRVLGSVP